MDIGRDLIDHRIVDLDGHDVGRVDDLWVCVADGRAVVGPIVSGAGALFQQFGTLGQRLQRIAPHTSDTATPSVGASSDGTTSSRCNDPRSCCSHGSPTSPGDRKATSSAPASNCSTPS